MIKKIMGSLSILAASIFVLAGLPSVVKADGLVIRPFDNRWDYSTEGTQSAFINYKDGVEKMVVSIDPGDIGNQGAVWIFPVPAGPKETTIDVLNELPHMTGEDIAQEAKLNITDGKMALLATQLYPILFAGLEKGDVQYSGSSGDTMPSLSAGSLGHSSSVDVYEHIEKAGVTSEILTTKTASGLYDYLKQKGLNVKIGSIEAIENYIGKDYSFIASWIAPTNKETLSEADIADMFQDYALYQGNFPQITTTLTNYLAGIPAYIEYQKNNLYSNVALQQSNFLDINSAVKNNVIQLIKNDPNLVGELQTGYKNIHHFSYGYSDKTDKGVFVNFPTKKMYFPLIPTSAYGSEIVPATIRVVGWVTPKIYKNIQSDTKTTYYQDNYYSPTAATKNFYDGAEKLHYTKISISAPSKMFTDDLWISSQTPAKVRFTELMANNIWIPGIILLILSAWLSGLMAGIIIFRKQTQGIKAVLSFGWLGLFNCLSIIGLIIATAFWKTRPIKKEDIELFRELKKRGYSDESFLTQDPRKFAYVPLTSIFFVIIVLVLSAGANVLI